LQLGEQELDEVELDGQELDELGQELAGTQVPLLGTLGRQV